MQLRKEYKSSKAKSVGFCKDVHQVRGEGEEKGEQRRKSRGTVRKAGTGQQETEMKETPYREHMGVVHEAGMATMQMNKSKRLILVREFQTNFVNKIS